MSHPGHLVGTRQAWVTASEPTEHVGGSCSLITIPVQVSLTLRTKPGAGAVSERSPPLSLSCSICGAHPLPAAPPKSKFTLLHRHLPAYPGLHRPLPPPPHWPEPPLSRVRGGFCLKLMLQINRSRKDECRRVPLTRGPWSSPFLGTDSRTGRQALAGMGSWC